MASFRLKVKSYFGKLLRNNDHDEEGFLGTSSPSIPASETLDQIGSWPVWKRQLDSQQTEFGLPTPSWVLQRIPDPTPFMSSMTTEGILADLEYSYENCIFEGPYRPKHPGSVLYCTVLGKIAKFACCHLCQSIARTVRSEFPVLASSQSPLEVVIWCADWGNLEANEANVAIVAKAFHNDGVFLTRGEDITEPRKIFEEADPEFFRRRRGFVGYISINFRSQTSVRLRVATCPKMAQYMPTVPWFMPGRS